MVERVPREIDPQFFDRFANEPMDQEEMPEWQSFSSAAPDSKFLSASSSGNSTQNWAGASRC